MIEFLNTLVADFLIILRDVAPVLAVVLFFQFAVLKQSLPNPKK